jgi:hypothetical protein
MRIQMTVDIDPVLWAQYRDLENIADVSQDVQTEMTKRVTAGVYGVAQMSVYLEVL